MNVSLPETLRAYVEKRVQDEGYASSSEYVRELIRRDRSRERLRAMIIDGIESGPARSLDDAYFDDLVASLDEST
ncbi:MAG: type II toxin-antitoxin system ParD family antitoxin [Trueperaceae bacterium]|nr:type II toxin-antitoxin system ParD family antitoxin [Trueperaceae bacterium]